MELKTEVASVVMAQIEEIMGDSGNPTDGDYYSAASYYMNNEKDMDKALEWINFYIEKTPSAYWGYRLKSQILAKKGMYKEAIAEATKSTELAVEAGNNDYVHNNGKSIEEWKKAL